MTRPIWRASGAVVGCPSFSVSYARNVSISPPTAKRPSTGKSISSAAALACSAKRAWATNTFASQSCTMYAISGPTRCQLIGIR